jgi:preprotein translocase subunit SecF
MFDKIMDKIDVTQYPYKRLMIVPLIVLLLALTVIGTNYLRTGQPVRFGMELEGGTAMDISSSTLEPEQLEGVLRDHFNNSEIRVLTVSGKLTVEAPASVDSAELETVLSEYAVIEKSTEIGAYFGTTLRDQALNALIYAFIGMAIVVFIVFRIPYPTIAVIFSASSDIAITAFLMSLLGLKLTLGTIAALLILIGYSVDSNILLTTKCLKRRGKVNERIRDAMKTGLTMASTTLSAMIVLFIVSRNPILRDIAAVIVLGLCVDLMNTWMFNAGILKWYLLREKSKKVYRRR